MNNAKAKAVVDEVAQLGGKLRIVQCDVSDAQQVARLVKECCADMPPIRGVIHGAMVLKVRDCFKYYTDWIADVL